MKRCSTSFSDREIDCLLQLLTKARQGDDVKLIARSPEIHSLTVRFTRLQMRLSGVVEGGKGDEEDDR